MNQDQRIAKLQKLIEEDIVRINNLGNQIAVMQSQVEEQLAIVRQIKKWAEELGFPTRYCTLCTDPQCPGDYSHFESSKGVLA